ncbi:hypothetical protein G9A89_011242 [Geosiphon pyriformis]|nr:hypothetical protein G9A89_011242 [Geosiphon pyriformis]
MEYHLPENAKQYLRYYDYWSRPRNEWNLQTFNTYLAQHGTVDKAKIHNAFEREITALKKLFARGHPIRMRLNELVGQLKTRRAQHEYETISMKNKMLEKKIDFAKNSVSLSGYRRINEHYENFHAKLLNVKRSTNKEDDESDEGQDENGDAEEDEDNNPFLVQLEGKEQEDDNFVDDGNKPEHEKEDAHLTCKRKLEDGSMSASIEEFTNTFRAMLNERKWRLSTGKLVEDALYEFGSKCMEEHLSHSFVLDPDDISYANEGIFTMAELNEIRAHKERNLPEMPQNLLNYLMTYAKSTVRELRCALRQPIGLVDDNFLREIYHDFDWLQLAMHSLVREYEIGSLKEDHHEQWYNLHLWGPIVDQCFADVMNMEAVRGESCSVASGLRKNANRTVPGKHILKKLKIGRKGDLVLRTTANLEFGGAEAGRFYKSKCGTKWITESGLKLPKMLKDMLLQLANEVGWSVHVLRELRTFGFMQGARHQMIIELDCPEGYVCRMRRGETFKVASDAITHMKETLPLMAVTWKVKTAVKECLERVLTHISNDSSTEEVFELVKHAGSSRKDAENIMQIHGCLQTPHKRSKKL